MIRPTTALTIGAPAKTIVITTGGLPPAPKASSTVNAPIAPATPATSDHQEPEAVKLQSAPFIHNGAKGAKTAVRK